MGNIPACVADVTTLMLGPYDLAWMVSCDLWIVAHLLAPFWLTVFTRSFTIGFLGVYLWETIEILFQSIFGSFVFFAEANDETESLALVLEDILQGLFGCLLGVVFNWIFLDAPPLLQFDDLRPARIRKHFGRFLFYLFFGVIAIGPGAMILGIYVGPSDEFPLGLVLYPVFYLIGFGFIILAQTQGWVEEGPKGPTKWKSFSEYWITGLLFTIITSVQHIWDYFYSRGIQSWVYALLFLWYLLIKKRI